MARAVIRLIGKVSPRLEGLCLKVMDNAELMRYLLAGVATTLVNYVVYIVVTRPFGGLIEPELLTEVGTGVAWAASVLFGYAVNKLFVFRKRRKSAAALFLEAAGFFAMRLVSFGMELALMYLTVDVLGLYDLVMKLVINLMVIIANYVFSKLIIFRR